MTLFEAYKGAPARPFSHGTFLSLACGLPIGFKYWRVPIINAFNQGK